MMKNKLVLMSVTILATLSLSGVASADANRDQIEAQGNAEIQSYWSQYQQALRDRQNAWEQSQGDIYTPAWQEANAKAGATYQEWLQARTALGDKLHNYDVEQWEKGSNSSSTATSNTPASSASESSYQPQASSANQSVEIAQPAPSTDTQLSAKANNATIQQPVKSATTRYAQSSISAMPYANQASSVEINNDNRSSSSNSQQPANQNVQATPASVESNKHTLPQTGNSNSLLGLGLASLTVTLGLGLKHKFN